MDVKQVQDRRKQGIGQGVKYTKQCVEQSSITGSDAIAVKRLQAVLRIKNGAEIKFCAVL